MVCTAYMITPSDAGNWSADDGQPAGGDLPAENCRPADGGSAVDGGQPTEVGRSANGRVFEQGGEAPAPVDDSVLAEKPARRAPRVRFQSEAEIQRSIEQVTALRNEYVAASRRIASAEADRARALAQLQQLALDESQSIREAEVRLRSLSAECAVAINLSDRTVLTQMSEAHKIVTDYPATLELLEAGGISLPHARAILAEGLNVTEDLIPEYEVHCLDAAAGASPGRLQKKARQIADRLTPRSIDERHRSATAERRVWFRELSDGMAEVGAVLPAVLALGIKDRIHQIAKAAKADADTTSGGTAGSPGWSLDAYRADVFAELLLTGIPSLSSTGQSEDDASGVTDTSEASGITPTAVQRHAAGVQARVSITVPAGGTASLDGYGPIDADTARSLATVAPGWDLIHKDTDGTILATSRRQPTEAMRRILRARDQHCRYPGCFVPVDNSEIDHTIDWAKGGPTTLTNLGFLCPKHHLLKHPDLPRNVRWNAYQDSSGVFTWVSPTGAAYVTTPEGSIVPAIMQDSAWQHEPTEQQAQTNRPAMSPWGTGFDNPLPELADTEPPGAEPPGTEPPGFELPSTALPLRHDDSQPF